jgi:hypothetical protein
MKLRDGWGTQFAVYSRNLYGLFGREEGEGEVLGGGGAAFGGLFEGGVSAMDGIFGLAAIEDLLDG